MSSLVLDHEPAISNAKVSGRKLIVYLTDGRELSIPIEWYPRLNNAKEEELLDIQILGNGYAIEWEQLDEHIGVHALLAGRKSGESKESIARWLEKRHS